MHRTAGIVVIGGGCTGTSIAWQLGARKAGRVILLERASLAGGATGRSSAIVRMHYTHETLARMALYARGVFENWEERVGGEVGFCRAGFLVLVGARDVPVMRRNVEMHRKLGIRAEVLTAAELRRLEPRMELGEAEVCEAAWEPDSGYADPHGATSGYAAAARREGVEVITGERVVKIQSSGGRVVGVETSRGVIESRTVVVAAGYRTRDLVAPLGLDLPLVPVRHTMAVVQRTAGFGAPHVVISDRVLGRYFRPEGTETTLIGTVSPLDGQIDTEVESERPAKAEELDKLAGGFWQRFAGEAEARLKGGFTGMYDCTPDYQPILGPTPEIPGLYLAAGFSGHGFKLSPAVGALMAEKIITGETTLVDLALFRLARFGEKRPITSPNAYSIATPG